MISVLLPTRGRPTNVARLLSSAFDTSETEVEFVLYVDEDDPLGDQTLDVAAREGATVKIGPRVTLSEMWNECWKLARFDVAMHCGDDIIFRTPDWDVRVLEAFDRYPDRIAFVHGRDGFQDARIGTHGFLHRCWIETVGYMVPPYFSSDYNDLWVTEVADMLGRRVYLPNVYTEHMHPVAGKGEWDQTHQERLLRHQRDNVDQLYRSLHAERISDVEKLKAAIAKHE